MLILSKELCADTGLKKSTINLILIVIAEGLEKLIDELAKDIKWRRFYENKFIFLTFFKLMNSFLIDKFLLFQWTFI